MHCVLAVSSTYLAGKGRLLALLVFCQVLSVGCDAQNRRLVTVNPYETVTNAWVDRQPGDESMLYVHAIFKPVSGSKPWRRLRLIQLEMQTTDLQTVELTKTKLEEHPDGGFELRAEGPGLQSVSNARIKVTLESASGPKQVTLEVPSVGATD